MTAADDGVSTDGRRGRSQDHRSVTTIFFATVTVLAAALVVFLAMRKRQS